MFTTQIDNILIDSNLTLSFISEDNEFVGSTPLLYCSGYFLGRIVIPNVKFVYRLSGNISLAILLSIPRGHQSIHQGSHTF